MKGQKLKPSISKSSDGPSSDWTPVSLHWRTGPISAMKNPQAVLSSYKGSHALKRTVFLFLRASKLPADMLPSAGFHSAM